MGFFELLIGKEKEETSLGDKILLSTENKDVIIPDHAKPKKVVKPKPVRRVGALFRINGVYDVGVEMMLSGVVEEGVLKKRMKTKINGADAVVSDLKVSSSSVKSLSWGEGGKIFLRGKGWQWLRNDDVLEFK